MNTRIYSAELRDELLAIVREPAALFFSILMPVGFFAMFVVMFGNEGDGMGIESIATYGAFGVMTVLMMNPGIGLADARERGWLRVQRVSGTALGTTLLAKVTAALPYALGVLTSITAVALGFGLFEFDVWTMTRLFVALLVGALPFSLISLAIGAKMSPNGATAVLNAILLPTVIASGLWFPLEIMPEFMQNLAPYLPPYHLSQLALAQTNGGAWGGHLLYLLGTTAIASILAGMAYRAARV